MATESPLISDGAQTVAAADYSAKQFYAVALSTAADRTSLLVSATGAQIYGILQNKPAAGEVCDVCLFGVSKALAVGTITRGNPIMADSTGKIVQWTSGSSYAQIGYAIESAATGQIFTAFIGATSPKVLT